MRFNNIKRNGEIIHNIPDSAFNYDYIILQKNKDGIWYFGADNDRTKATWVAKVNTDKDNFLYVVPVSELNTEKVLSEIMDLNELVEDREVTYD